MASRQQVPMHLQQTIPDAFALLSCANVLREGKHRIGAFCDVIVLEEAIESTWRGMLVGWQAVMDFMKSPDNGQTWILDPNSKVDTKGRCKTLRIRNGMDAAEETRPRN